MAVSRTDVLVSLPRPLTSLIGRQQELDHLYDLLRSDVALVTVTGFGGIGKTRLSLQAALELEPTFDAGAIFVPLAAITQGSSIPLAIAKTAGLDESVDTVEALAERFGPASRLLVLDNLEQIPDAAEVVLELLRAMPQLTVLATSRSRLELGGEHVLPLEPLETDAEKSGAELRELPAIQIFLERGRAAAPSMPTDDEAITIIGDICQRLDGIPLAIELAAARLTIFSLADLRHQLDHQLPVLASKRVDMPERQKTMRNAIAWTYELLEPSERRLFTWLSVYEQDFSLESIRHVAHQLELTDDPLDLVQFLVSRSLIRPSRIKSEAPRYQMLQMLREFGHEQLIAMNEDAIARRSHAMDMVALAERADPQLVTGEATQWMEVLNDDLPSIYAAVRWAVAAGERSIALRIIGSGFRYFEAYGHAARFLGFDLDLDAKGTDPAILAKALVGTGNLKQSLYQLDNAREDFSRALELAREASDERLQVSALLGLGIVEYGVSDLPLSLQYHEQARGISERINYTYGLVGSRSMLGTIKIQQDKAPEAIEELKDLLSIVETQGDHVLAARLCANLATAYDRELRLEEGNEILLRALMHAEKNRNVSTLARVYANLTANRLFSQNYDEAQEFAEKGLVYARETGARHVEAVLLINLSIVHSNRGELGTAADILTQTSRLMENEDGIRYFVHVGTEIVDICKAIGMRSRIVELLAAVLAWRERLQLPLTQSGDDSEQELLDELRAEGLPDFDDRVARGLQFDMKALGTEMRAVASAIIAEHPPGETAPGTEAKPAFILTPRETEVLGMLATGLTNAEIAEEMFVSTRTVTTHLTNIFTKLEVSNRSRAVAVAMQAGLI